MKKLLSLLSAFMLVTSASAPLASCSIGSSTDESIDPVLEQQNFNALLDSDKRIGQKLLPNIQPKDMFYSNGLNGDNKYIGNREDNVTGSFGSSKWTLVDLLNQKFNLGLKKDATAHEYNGYWSGPDEITKEDLLNRNDAIDYKVDNFDKLQGITISDVEGSYQEGGDAPVKNDSAKSIKAFDDIVKIGSHGYDSDDQKNWKDMVSFLNNEDGYFKDRTYTKKTTVKSADGQSFTFTQMVMISNTLLFAKDNRLNDIVTSLKKSYDDIAGGTSEIKGLGYDKFMNLVLSNMNIFTAQSQEYSVAVNLDCNNLMRQLTNVANDTNALKKIAQDYINDNNESVFRDYFSNNLSSNQTSKSFESKNFAAQDTVEADDEDAADNSKVNIKTAAINKDGTVITLTTDNLVVDAKADDFTLTGAEISSVDGKAGTNTVSITLKSSVAKDASLTISGYATTTPISVDMSAMNVLDNSNISIKSAVLNDSTLTVGLSSTLNADIKISDIQIDQTALNDSSKIISGSTKGSDEIVVNLSDAIVKSINKGSTVLINGLKQIPVPIKKTNSTVSVTGATVEHNILKITLDSPLFEDVTVGQIKIDKSSLKNSTITNGGHAGDKNIDVTLADDDLASIKDGAPLLIDGLKQVPVNIKVILDNTDISVKSAELNDTSKELFIFLDKPLAIDIDITDIKVDGTPLSSDSTVDNSGLKAGNKIIDIHLSDNDSKIVKVGKTISIDKLKKSSVTITEAKNVLTFSNGKNAISVYFSELGSGWANVVPRIGLPLVAIQSKDSDGQNIEYTIDPKSPYLDKLLGYINNQVGQQLGYKIKKDDLSITVSKGKDSTDSTALESTDTITIIGNSHADDPNVKDDNSLSITGSVSLSDKQINSDNLDNKGLNDLTDKLIYVPKESSIKSDDWLTKTFLSNNSKDLLSLGKQYFMDSVKQTETGQLATARNEKIVVKSSDSKSYNFDKVNAFLKEAVNLLNTTTFSTSLNGQTKKLIDEYKTNTQVLISKFDYTDYQIKPISFDVQNIKLKNN